MLLKIMKLRIASWCYGNRSWTMKVLGKLGSVKQPYVEGIASWIDVLVMAKCKVAK